MTHRRLHKTRPALPDPCAAEAAEAVVQDATGIKGWRARELRSSRIVRSFLLRAKGTRDRMLRFAREATPLLLDVQAQRHLVESEVGLAVELDCTGTDVEPAPFSLSQGTGRLSTPAVNRLDIAVVAELLARQHGLPALALMRSFPAQEKPNIMTAFQRLVENQRTYLKYRVQDGLPQDMLALTLADLGRVVRRFMVAQEHYFLPHPRRVLCHGCPAPTRLIRDRRGLHLFGFEEARIGDAARDVAVFSVSARLDEADEATLLEVYLDALAGRDDRFIHRYFAHKVLVLLEWPVARLLGLYRIKYEDAPVFGEVVEVLLEEVAEATAELATALTTLNDFQGRGRPLAPRDVRSMGRLVTYEEYLLRDQDLVVAVEGSAYTGKTAVATQLAARLGARYLNLGALLRAGVSLSGADPAQAQPHQIVEAVRAHEVTVEITAKDPFYTLSVDGEDVTDELREAELYDAQTRLLADAASRAQLAQVVAHLTSGSTVIEAACLDGVVPKHTHRVTLISDRRTRDRRRDELAAARGVELPLPAPVTTTAGPDQILDTSSASIPQLVLEVVQRCLPESVREEILVPDFTGRRPVFER